MGARAGIVHFRDKRGHGFGIAHKPSGHLCVLRTRTRLSLNHVRPRAQQHNNIGPASINDEPSYLLTAPSRHLDLSERTIRRLYICGLKQSAACNQYGEEAWLFSHWQARRVTKVFDIARHLEGQMGQSGSRFSIQLQCVRNALTVLLTCGVLVSWNQV